MKKSFYGLLLGFVLLACSLPAGILGDGSYKDDFSTTGNWGLGTDAESSVEYANGALQMQVYKENFFVWSNPPEKDYEKVRVEVTVKNNSTDPLASFGILCHQQVTDSAFYYATVAPNGDYLIAKTAVAQDNVFLTNNGEWGNSDKITQNASSYKMALECADGKITLFVDGQEIDSASDSSYTKGEVGLLAWSGTEANQTDFAFDDFSATPITAQE